MKGRLRPCVTNCKISKLHFANICCVWMHHMVLPSALALAMARFLGLAMAEHTVDAINVISL